MFAELQRKGIFFTKGFTCAFLLENGGPIRSIYRIQHERIGFPSHNGAHYEGMKEVEDRYIIENQ